MKQEEVIQKTINFVQVVLADAEGGHDWWHISMVWKLSKTIAKTEDVDLFIVELGALLHDIADSKFHDGDEELGPKKARKFLTSLDVEESVITHIENIINNISFKGGRENQKFRSNELDVIQNNNKIINEM